MNVIDELNCPLQVHSDWRKNISPIPFQSFSIQFNRFDSIKGNKTGMGQYYIVYVQVVVCLTQTCFWYSLFFQVCVRFLSLIEHVKTP